MKVWSEYDLALACSGQGYTAQELLNHAILRGPAELRGATEIVFDRQLFYYFALELGSMKGTVYPYKDGGILYAGPTNWILVKPGYAPQNPDT